MSKREKLQKIVDEAIAENDSLYDFTIEFRGRGGWWAVPLDRRYFGDEGEFLGTDYSQAKKSLFWLLG